MLKLRLALFLLVISNCCFGQKALLMLEKSNQDKTVYYEIGDEISFRVSDSKRKFTGKIRDFADSIIVFRGFEVNVGDISSLYIDNKTKWWLRYKIEQLSLLVGGGYLVLDIVNNGEVHKDTLIISGALIGVGLLAKAIIGNRIKIRGKTKLRIVEL